MKLAALTAIAAVCAGVFHTSAASAEDFAIAFAWDGIERCTKVPPEIALSNVPDGTARFEVKLVDLDFKPFNHGGGTAPNSGDGTIAEADYETFTYKGPCPPGTSHTYEFTVRALAADGRPLARAKAKADFPPRR